jgi:lysophospholipid hydrolase
VLLHFDACPRGEYLKPQCADSLLIIFEQFGTLQFGKFEEIQSKGYHAAVKILQELEASAQLPSSFIDGKEEGLGGKKKGRSARRSSI